MDRDNVVRREIHIAQINELSPNGGSHRIGGF